MKQTEGMMKFKRKKNNYIFNKGITIIDKCLPEVSQKWIQIRNSVLSKKQQKQEDAQKRKKKKPK